MVPEINLKWEQMNLINEWGARHTEINCYNYGSVIGGKRIYEFVYLLMTKHNLIDLRSNTKITRPIANNPNIETMNFKPAETGESDRFFVR